MIRFNGSEFYEAGTDISTGFEDAVALARKTGQVVKLTWNNKTYAVTYSDSVKDLIRRRDREYQAVFGSWKKKWRRDSKQIHRKAKAAARTLPQELLAWATGPKRAYGKSASILIAADAVRIANQYGTAEAIQAAIDNGSLAVFADSGEETWITLRLAKGIVNKDFPITHLNH